MKNGLWIIAVIACLIIGPAPSYGLDVIDRKESAELARMWNVFLKAVSAGDLKTIRSLSVEKIRCLSCVDNTEEEARDIESLQATDPEWYRKLYQEKIYIPVNRFCDEDYPILFTKKFIKRLQSRTPTYAVEEFHGLKIYEVIVSTLEPGELSPGHEGSLHLFQFVKTKSGYRFWGIDTVP